MAAPPEDGGTVEPTPIKGPALKLRVRSSDDLQPLPARMIIYAVAPTKTPAFQSDGAVARLVTATVLGSTEGVYLITGEAVLPIPAGTYDLLFVQGPEYEQVRLRVTIEEGGVTPVDVILEHSVRTDGWLAADMHIHTARSFDSRVAPAHRVISEVASGIELIVPTDHTFHNDLQKYVDSIGYEDRAISIPGSEYGFLSGHLGVYPVEFDPKSRLWGAPEWEDYSNWRNLPDKVVFPMIHGLPGQPVVVVNHPRLLPDLGYFTNIGWSGADGRNLDTADMFDGVEILNGYDNAPGETTDLLRDWFAILNDGHRVTGLGNSDTHRMDWLRAGYPRSWLRLSTDEVKRVLPGDLREAIRSMRAVASNGPFVQMNVEGQEIGTTVKVPAATRRVRIRVVADAAGWIDLTRLLIYRNGTQVKEIPITRRQHPALVEEFDLDVPYDGWVVAMALGDLPLPVDVIGQVKGGAARPLAVTNPIWLDYDSDGVVKPPKLPPPRPRPFGLVAQDVFNIEGRTPQRATDLHAPLDCEPDQYLDWLERHKAR